MEAVRMKLSPGIGLATFHGDYVARQCTECGNWFQPQIANVKACRPSCAKARQVRREKAKRDKKSSK